jgi:hypothetical protein
MKNPINIFYPFMALFLSVSMTSNAQINIPPKQLGFEELQSTLAPDEYWNGSNGNTRYQFDQDSYFLEMEIGWDTSWGGYWKNMWAFSRQRYNAEEPSDFATQLYASKPGKGVESDGEIYAIGRQDAYLTNHRTNAQKITGFSVSNTTFAYNSMKFGDAFAKKFNAADKDSFVLVISAFSEGQALIEKRVYLANFQSADTNEHYLLDTWQYVSLAEVNADSIHFRLISSDSGIYGINTPTYFTLDGIDFESTATKKNQSRLTLNLYPNPVISTLNISQLESLERVFIYNQLGQEMAQWVRPTAPLDVQDFIPGVYMLKAHDKMGNFCTIPFLKSND